MDLELVGHILTGGERTGINSQGKLEQEYQHVPKQVTMNKPSIKTNTKTFFVYLESIPSCLHLSPFVAQVL